MSKETQQDIISSFFKSLACRFRKENGLSDVTWAMCETSQQFKELFIHFFFPKIDVSKITVFEREFSRNGCRPDFYIKTDDDSEYVIENKIYDNKQHFDKYLDEFCNSDSSRLGYITNYPFFKSGFTTKMWEDFADSLCAEFGSFDIQESALIEAYLNFLQSVCYIKNKRNMKKIENLDVITSFFDFITIVKDAIKNEEFEGFKTTFDKLCRDEDFKYCGFYFTVNDIDTKGKKPFVVWIGVYGTAKSIQIHVENKQIKIKKEQKSAKIFYDYLSKNNPQSLKYSSWSSNKDESFIFTSNPTFETEFVGATTVDAQKEIIKKFVKEIIELYFKNDADTYAASAAGSV
jgi:hypothetical protein